MRNGAETPLRRTPATVVDGVRVVRETGAAWLDGSEQILFERLGSGLPLDSLSDELFATAEDWPQRYHLSPARANVVRALDLPGDATVLEVGAGCGAITRYLGEACSVVDALEPTFARARVAARRTAELPGVVVVNAEVEDLPDEAAYDVVVVVGVLEYVGGGRPDRQPYVEFLDRLRRVLRPGGQLILAIENALGVKYLAGAPEDHSNEVFHSVEGYPQDGPARTFSRRSLESLVLAAGFSTTRTLGTFPDYKLTRVVLDQEILDGAPGLATQLPRFPSPDWVKPRPLLADEERLWDQLVDARVGIDFANSFLLVAGVGPEAKTSLWPAGRLASYFSTNRRRALQVEKTVRRAGDAVVVESRRLGEGEVDGLTVLPYSETWTAGESMTARLRLHPGLLPELVRSWRALLDERVSQSTEGTPFDVTPGNVHIDQSGSRIIDDEWRAADLDERAVVLRGALLLARDLVDTHPATVWGCTDGLDLFRSIAAHAGVEVGPDVALATVRAEAELQALVGGGSPGTARHAETIAIVERDLLRALQEPREGRRAPRAWESAATSEASAIEARDVLFATGEQLDQARSELDRLRAEVDRLTIERQADQTRVQALVRKQSELENHARHLEGGVVTRSARRAERVARRLLARVRA